MQPGEVWQPIDERVGYYCVMAVGRRWVIVSPLFWQGSRLVYQRHRKKHFREWHAPISANRPPGYLMDVVAERWKKQLRRRLKFVYNPGPRLKKEIKNAKKAFKR